jgi:hypothetical protein
LETAKISAFARGVAAETVMPPVGSLTREVTKTATVSEIRKGGLFGLKTKTVQVPRTTTVREEVVGAHWVLHSTYHNIETNQRGTYSEYFEQNYWILQNDGALLKVRNWEEAKKTSSGISVETDLTAWPMTEEDMLALDHDFPSYERGRHGSDFKCWGNREPGRVARHAKGGGVSLALKALLEGSQHP